MSTISLRLPESLHRQLRELAKRDGISINQFAATALSEKMACLMTSEYLRERAEGGSRAAFDHALSKVSSTTVPSPDDRI
jgi:hypothetical protein